MMHIDFQFIVHGDLQSPKTQSLLKLINSKFNPTSPILYVPAPSSDHNAHQPWLASKNPVVESVYQKGLDIPDGAEVFMCEAGSCQMPMETAEELETVLNEE
jgi:uncharacterized protein YyaL (SSP411 family)